MEHIDLVTGPALVSPTRRYVEGGQSSHEFEGQRTQAQEVERHDNISLRVTGYEPSLGSVLAMSADFWAGYISGAVGIVIGNPLDILKVRLQANAPSAPVSSPTSVVPLSPAPSTLSSFLRPFITGTAAPVLGYGALNALLFVSYNRTEAALNHAVLGLPQDSAPGINLATTWIAGAVGGLATWAVSTPTELVKCRAQLAVSASEGSSSSSTSSWQVARAVLRTEGIRGMYLGGTVTAFRDSIGYGFYFWSYELASRLMLGARTNPANEVAADDPVEGGLVGTDAARVLLCGGLAGVVTWASIFPLDVIKTRVQTQDVGASEAERTRLLASPSRSGQVPQQQPHRRLGAWDIAKETYTQGGVRPFFAGLMVCSVRAFIVNAFQWAVYEWIMLELGQGRRRTSPEVAV